MLLNTGPTHDGRIAPIMEEMDKRGARKCLSLQEEGLFM